MTAHFPLFDDRRVIEREIKQKEEHTATKNAHQRESDKINSKRAG